MIEFDDQLILCKCGHEMNYYPSMNLQFIRCPKCKRWGQWRIVNPDWDEER